MIERKIETFLVKQMAAGLIKEEDISVYSYGYTLMLEMFVNFVVAMIIGLLLDKVLLISVFLIAFIPLRSFAGGYHANKAWKCFILSNSVILMAIWVAQFICSIDVLAQFLLVEVALGLIIAKLAPVQSENKKISKLEADFYKRIVVVIFIVEILMEMVIYLFNDKNITGVIFAAHVVVTISLMVGKYQEKGKQH